MKKRDNYQRKKKSNWGRKSVLVVGYFWLVDSRVALFTWEHAGIILACPVGNTSEKNRR